MIKLSSKIRNPKLKADTIYKSYRRPVLSVSLENIDKPKLNAKISVDKVSATKVALCFDDRAGIAIISATSMAMQNYIKNWLRFVRPQVSDKTPFIGNVWPN